MAEHETDSPMEHPSNDAASGAAQDEKTLSDTQIEGFSSALAADPKEAYGRWGLALYHSLSDEEAQSQLSVLKIDPRDALGYYNQGVTLAGKGKFADAAAAFAKASELDRNFPEAVYNQALAEEKSGKAPEARKLWNRYLEMCDDPEETNEIKNHITELANR